MRSCHFAHTDQDVAGKTTLVSRIIDDMTERTTLQRPLLNFYFEYGQSGKTLMVDMLRSFIEQLLQQDDAIVDDLHDTVLPAHPSEISSVSWLTSVATRILLAQRSCYIVVDGVDECALDQRKHILQWLKTILSESKVSNVVVKILVSGQRDGVIDAALHDCACNITLDDQARHLRDIENFASSILNQIKDRFPDLEEEEGILQRLEPSRISEASKGIKYSPSWFRYESWLSLRQECSCTRKWFLTTYFLRHQFMSWKKSSKGNILEGWMRLTTVSLSESWKRLQMPASKPHCKSWV